MFARFQGQISRFRSVGLAGLALALGAGVVALPGPAIAAGNHSHKAKTCTKASTLCTISTGAVSTNEGFKLHLYVNQSNEGYGNPNETSFNAILRRKRVHVTQTDEYSFSDVKLTGTSNLSSAQLKGTFEDGRGSINMKFRATGSESKAAGCEGPSGKKRRGVLSGSLTLKADKLGTVRLKSVKATLSTAVNLCGPRAVKGYLLEGYSSNGADYVTASKPKPTGPIREEITVSKQTSTYGFTYTYSVANEPTSDYTVASKLSKATVKGASGIKGTATYKGKKSSSYSLGKLTGDLSVNMAALGVVKPFASAKNHSLSGDQRYHK